MLSASSVSFRYERPDPARELDALLSDPALGGTSKDGSDASNPSITDIDDPS